MNPLACRQSIDKQGSGRDLLCQSMSYFGRSLELDLFKFKLTPGQGSTQGSEEGVINEKSRNYDRT